MGEYSAASSTGESLPLLHCWAGGLIIEKIFINDFPCLVELVDGTRFCACQGLGIVHAISG